LRAGDFVGGEAMQADKMRLGSVLRVLRSARSERNGRAHITRSNKQENHESLLYPRRTEIDSKKKRKKNHDSLQYEENSKMIDTFME
jgi:hypothetical protein